MLVFFFGATLSTIISSSISVDVIADEAFHNTCITSNSRLVKYNANGKLYVETKNEKSSKKLTVLEAFTKDHKREMINYVI